MSKFSSESYGFRRRRAFLCGDCLLRTAKCLAFPGKDGRGSGERHDAVLRARIDGFVTMQIPVAPKHEPRILFINFSKPVGFLDIQRAPLEIPEHEEIRALRIILRVAVGPAMHPTITADVGNAWIAEHLTAQFQYWPAPLRIRVHARHQVLPPVSHQLWTAKIGTEIVLPPFPISEQFLELCQVFVHFFYL